MVFGSMIARAAGVVATGAIGAVAYDGLKTVMRGPVLRRAAVTATSGGLRGARAAETGAEKARLSAADIVAEAHERLGEQAPPPGTTAPGAAHEH